MSNMSFTEDQLEALLEKAARKGAHQALREVGLHDDDAVHDIRDLRDLIDGWRSMKRSVGSVVLKWITVAILGFVSLGIWSSLEK